MKKIVFLSIASLFFAATTHAQSIADTTAKTHKAWNKHKDKQNDEEFYKKLNLTEDQKAQLKTINKDQKSKIAAIKSNTTLTEDQKKAQVKAAKTDAYNKRQAIYTPEQKEVIKNDHEKKHGKKDNSASETE
ncbi:MAG: hypothetical protein PW786_04190 [Arachidicoccus sp.]|nr:hypothetical protein [Arachidicoccus sp.]